MQHLQLPRMSHCEVVVLAASFEQMPGTLQTTPKDERVPAVLGRKQGPCQSWRGLCGEGLVGSIDNGVFLNILDQLLRPQRPIAAPQAPLEVDSCRIRLTSLGDKFHANSSPHIRIDYAVETDKNESLRGLTMPYHGFAVRSPYNKPDTNHTYVWRGPPDHPSEKGPCHNKGALFNSEVGRSPPPLILPRISILKDTHICAPICSIHSTPHIPLVQIGSPGSNEHVWCSQGNPFKSLDLVARLPCPEATGQQHHCSGVGTCQNRNSDPQMATLLLASI